MYQDIILFWDLQVSFPLQTQSILISAFRLYILARELTKSKYVCQHWWDGVVGRRWDFSRLGTGLWSRWYWLGCCRLARWVVERMDQLSCHPIIDKKPKSTQIFACTSLVWKILACAATMAWMMQNYWSLGAPVGFVCAEQSLTVWQTEWRWPCFKSSLLSASHCLSGSHQHMTCCFTVFSASSFFISTRFTLPVWSEKRSATQCK